MSLNVLLFFTLWLINGIFSETGKKYSSRYTYVGLFVLNVVCETFLKANPQNNDTLYLVAMYLVLINDSY